MDLAALRAEIAVHPWHAMLTAFVVGGCLALPRRGPLARLVLREALARYGFTAAARASLREHA